MYEDRKKKKKKSTLMKNVISKLKMCVCVCVGGGGGGAVGGKLKPLMAQMIYRSMHTKFAFAV